MMSIGVGDECSQLSHTHIMSGILAGQRSVGDMQGDDEQVHTQSSQIGVLGAEGAAAVAADIVIILQ